MRITQPVFLVLPIFLIACGDETPPETVTETPQTVPAVGAPSAGIAKHGGSVVRVGTHPVEVVTHASGEVYAYVESDVPSPEDDPMRVEVSVLGGRRPLDLSWNARRRRYEGRLVRETIIAGPVNVTYVIEGIPLVAIIPVCIVAPAITVSVRVDRDDHHHHHRHHGKHKHKWRH